MIGRIQGTLIHKIPPVVLIDVHGIGYEISVSMHTLYELPCEGETATIFTHLIVREDAHTLYGFAELQERSLFKNLLKVNGVGPKSALAILSSCSVTHFQLCVEHEDIASLTKIPGIGRKTAERLIIEMRGNIADWGRALPVNSAKTTATSSFVPSARQDAISALVALGYKPMDASKVITHLDVGDKSSELLIREALKQI